MKNEQDIFNIVSSSKHLYLQILFAILSWKTTTNKPKANAKPTKSKVIIYWLIV